MTVIVDVKISEADFQRAAREEELRIERNLNKGVDRILDEIEQAQIASYGASDNPAQPAGSTYVRTFNLQGASKKQRTSRVLPEISGLWSVDEGKARYGEFVLGTRSEQAKVHRGRWKPRTQVESEIKEKSPQIIEEELRKQ